MLKKIKSTVAIGLLTTTLIFPVGAQAFEVQFLNNSAERFFTQEDWDLAVDAAKEAIKAPEHKVVEWRNPKTNNHGDMSARSIGTLEGRPCRALSMVSWARGRTNSSSYILCEQEDGTWRIPGSGAAILDDEN